MNYEDPLKFNYMLSLWDAIWEQMPDAIKQGAIDDQHAARRAATIAELKRKVGVK